MARKKKSIEAVTVNDALEQILDKMEQDVILFQLTPKIEIDQTSGTIRVVCDGFAGWFYLFINGVRHKNYRMENGSRSIELPNVINKGEYRLSVELIQ